MRRVLLPSLPPSARTLAAVLLAADAVAVAFFVAWKLDLVTAQGFDLGHDRGLAETLQYVKLAGIGACGVVLFRRTRQPVHLALAALFVGLVIDDAAMLHERLGAALADGLALPAPPHLRPHDVGELLFVALWVGPVFLFGIAAYRRSDAAARRVARAALAALGALAVFGVGADLLHQVWTSMVDVRGLHSALTLVEEGGEMLVLTAIAIGAAAVVARRTPAGGDGYAPGVPTSWPPSITNRPPVTNDEALDAR